MPPNYQYNKKGNLQMLKKINNTINNGNKRLPKIHIVLQEAVGINSICVY